MSAVKVRAALEAALSAMTPSLESAWENVTYTPVAGTPYQRVHVLFADPDNLGYGATRYREQGIMQVTLMYPANTGPLAASTRAELIRATFHRGATFTASGVQVIIEKTPTIGVGQQEGDRFTLPVKVRFFANII